MNLSRAVSRPEDTSSWHNINEKMKFRHLLSITIALLGSNSTFSQSTNEYVNYFSNNAFGNPIVGKAGEHYKGVTYVAYQGEKEDSYVAAYHHETRKWIGPYKAGTSLLGKTPGMKIDNHGKPTLVVDGEGYIHVVFGGHGGTKDLGENTLGNYFKGKQIHVKTKKPMDISSWEVVDNITPFGTYSQFLKMDNGDIYLIFRHGAHRSNWVYQISKDNGRTFTPKVSFLDAKPTEEDVNDWDSWYIDLARGEGNDILVSYNYHFCKSSKKGHDGERHHGYFMKLDTDSKEWFNVKGEKLAIPVTKEQADTMTLVKNTGDLWNHIGKVGLSKDGLPRVSWYEGEHDGSKHGGPKQLVGYQWTGSQWIGSRSNLPIEARGEIRAISIDSVSYLLGSMQQNMGEVAWWHGVDGGVNFSKGEVLLKHNGEKITLSHFIRNSHPDAMILATQKIKGTDYSKIFLLGENGAIERTKNEADILEIE
ncbi:BNR repeat-containing protein [Reichenbachiella ulvae]|uniref:BNR repeat-containing protein n=1 Tax=Reichenbachiella ulvae TaxID=2980104 RepID=A0ABT3CSH0_9BACT|nr:BNR repeat-containing protein [Reichenbachiella ulvae]MCV9386645.1 BNR repeat-containing protein [Reichenbachiella ulvae]